MENLKKYLTTNELCKYLNKSRVTIMKWTRLKLIPYKRCGHQYRYEMHEIDAAMDKGIDLNS